MGFPPEIKQKALVAAARHCSVCHRFKGVNVDVHHIIPKNNGGSDDYSNAIVLCFDCHSDAGHYNPKHPRGNKYSPQELTLHRDNWYRIVEEHGIQPPENPDGLHCRYLICSSFNDISEISAGDFSSFPIDNPILLQNSVLDFQRKLISLNKDSYRNDEIYFRSYQTEEEYLTAHGSVAQVESDNVNGFSYFYAKRTPSSDETKNIFVEKDPITFFFHKNGVPPELLSIAFAGRCECGGSGELEEHFRIRPIWFAYLAIKNINTTPVYLDKLICNYDNNAGAYPRLLNYLNITYENSLLLPKAAIAPGETVLIPLLTILAPINPAKYNTFASEYRPLSVEQGQCIERADISESVSDFSLIGPSILSKSIIAGTNTVTTVQQIHELDFKNFYLISRHWMVGSCPHLFAKSFYEEKLHYIDEVFSDAPGVNSIYKYIVPKGVKSIIIAELEFEITKIKNISINSEVQYKNIQLLRGDKIEINVSPGDEVSIIGSYELLSAQSHNKIRPWQKYELVNRYLWQNT